VSELFWRPDGLDVFVEAVGSCNLSCPACGNGHMPRSARPQGLLTAELLERVLDKVLAETPAGSVPRVHLFNWGEPLLHPELPDLVARVKRRGLPCRLSSNLVRPRDLEAVVGARPDWLRVSVSGFRQEVYGRSHRGGDVERVKENLRRLRALIDVGGAPLAVEVNYHVYRHNVGPDYGAMRGLALELGFEFRPVWSIPGSVESVLEWERGVVRPELEEHLQRLAIAPGAMQRIARKYEHLLPEGECPLRATTIVNSDGSVDLCCASYTGRVAESYLDVPAAELAARKQAHPLCGPCIRGAWHLVFLQAGQEEWNAEGLRVVEADARSATGT